MDRWIDGWMYIVFSVQTEQYTRKGCDRYS